MSDKLKACPFCGSDPAVKEVYPNLFDVRCVNNACNMVVMHHIPAKNIEDAVKTWNTRPLEDAANARAEAAEAKVAALQAELIRAIDIYKDPAVAHANILNGRIVLPKFYINITDDFGPVADLRAALDAANSALISMVYQYCYRPLDANKEPAIDIYQHDFMSAGEEAFAYLVEHGLAKWTDESHYAILINSKSSLSVKSDD